MPTFFGKELVSIGLFEFDADESDSREIAGLVPGSYVVFGHGRRELTKIFDEMYGPEGFYLGAVARTADDAKAGGAAATGQTLKVLPKGPRRYFATR
jgi:hypothetical protein